MSNIATELASTPTITSKAAKNNPIADTTTLNIKKSNQKNKKSPSHFIFRLCETHQKYYDGASIYPPRFIIPNKDVILFNYGTTDNPDLRPRRIRYIDGYKTIFVDEQDGKDPVPDNILNSSRNTITFEFGSLTVPAWNKPLLEFLMLSNSCEQNTNKAKMTANVYRMLDFHNSDINTVEIGKKKDLAYDMARNASLDEMIPHAKFLGISFIHPATGEERDYDVIREDYKAKALQDPDNFMLYANNPRVKYMYIVEQGLKNNVITTELVKGQLHWSGSKQLITVLDQSVPDKEAIADFAMTDTGLTFIKTLKTQLSL